MKRIYCIILFFLLISCNEKKEVYKISLNSLNVGVALTKNHLFLKEYKIFLVTFSKENNELSSIRLMDDNGTGANCYLYDSGKNYTVIDCDGSWYSVDKRKGDIELIGKFWLKKPPGNYLGTFMLTNIMNKVSFVKEKSVKSDEMYKYGGG